MSIGDNPFDQVDDRETIDALELLESIRPQSRPSWSPEIDRLCVEASRFGWTIERLSGAIERDLGNGAGPGVAMMLLRRLCLSPPPRVRPPRQTRTALAVSHAPCDQPEHGPDCQVCYCEGERVHARVVPMPDHIKEQFSAMFAGFGKVPSGE